MTTLFQAGDFTLNSGAKSSWKIECDALSPDDWAGLAQIALQLLGPTKFEAVYGVPRGGIPFAEALKPFCTSDAGLILIVDDVLTTGGSMERFCNQVMVEMSAILSAKRYLTKQMRMLGLCVFARGKCPIWFKTLFQMPEELWLPKLPAIEEGPRP